jgi:hypothetical protein
MCTKRMWTESVSKIQDSHSHYSYSRHQDSSQTSRFPVRSTLYRFMLSLLQIHFCSGQSNFVLVPMRLSIASSRVLCATIFRRAARARASRRKWRYLLRGSIFRWPMASWRRVDSTVVKLMQYIVGSGAVTACETFFACISDYFIA